jgi:hypothetical protein
VAAGDGGRGVAGGGDPGGQGAEPVPAGGCCRAERACVAASHAGRTRYRCGGRAGSGPAAHEGTRVPRPAVAAGRGGVGRGPGRPGPDAGPRRAGDDRDGPGCRARPRGARAGLGGARPAGPALAAPGRRRRGAGVAGQPVGPAGPGRPGGGRAARGAAPGGLAGHGRSRARDRPLAGPAGLGRRPGPGRRAGLVAARPASRAGGGLRLPGRRPAHLAAGRRRPGHGDPDLAPPVRRQVGPSLAGGPAARLDGDHRGRGAGRRRPWVPGRPGPAVRRARRRGRPGRGRHPDARRGRRRRAGRPGGPPVDRGRGGARPGRAARRPGRRLGSPVPPDRRRRPGPAGGHGEEPGPRLLGGQRRESRRPGPAAGRRGHRDRVLERASRPGRRGVRTSC